MSSLLRDLRPLIVPGLRDSGEGHWQTLWQQQLAAQRVEQRNWNAAELAPWTQRVIETVQADPRPSLLIAHSFGCLATVQALAQTAPGNVAAVLLVAGQPGEVQAAVRHIASAAELPGHPGGQRLRPLAGY